MAQCKGRTTEGNQCKLNALEGTNRCKRHTEKAEALPFESARQAAATVGYLHTGNYVLDYVISGKLDQGGWPLGHVSEIFGENSSGKSFLVNRAIAIAQQQGGDALLDDTEGAFNPDWAEDALGVDANALRMASSLTVQDHWRVVQTYTEWLVTQPQITKAILACDSIAVLSTEHEIATAFDKADMGRRAKEIRMMFRTLKKHLRAVPMAYICTNHVIANIGGWSDTTTPTGSGVKFHAGVRLELRNPRKIKIEGTKDYRGVVVQPFVAKNRFGAPWKSCELAIPFYEPINALSGLVPFLVEYGYFGVDTKGFLTASDGASLGIRAYKSDLLKADKSAQQLLELYPDLIKEVDQWLSTKAAQFRINGEVIEDG